MIIAIIYIDQAQRRIPISFAKRVRGRRVMGGQSTYIPLKVNTAGVIPVIFASSVMLFPSLLVTAIPNNSRFMQGIYRWINSNLGGGGTGQVSIWYVLILFFLIIGFTYFYTSIQFDPAAPRRDAATPGWLHSRRPSGLPDAALPQPHSQSDHTPGFDLPRADRGHSHPRLVDLGNSDRVLGSLDSDRRWRCDRDDEADREPAHYAQL